MKKFLLLGFIFLTLFSCKSSSNDNIEEVGSEHSDCNSTKEIIVRDWLNWPGIGLCLTIISTTIAYIFNLNSHRKTQKFDLVLSKIFPAIEDFIKIANKYKDNVNTFSLSHLKQRDYKIMDEFFTYPKLDLKNKSFVLSLFLKKEDRSPFMNVVEITNNFSLALFKIESNDTYIQAQNKYDTARRTFNKDFDKAMSDCLNLLYVKLFKHWQD